MEAWRESSPPSPVPVARVDVQALYLQHWRGLVRLAVLLVDDLPSAEDVVQEAFIGLHRQAASLRDPEAALAYVRSAVVNRSRSTIRRRQVSRRHQYLSEPEPAPGADRHLELAEDQQAALAAVRRLPGRQREVLMLRYWSDLSEAEIAAALGISAGTVKSSASRAMASLRETLGANR
ncbi:SigE family RNA polymerase sigma factor [Jatrophihabitans sp. YIM 134969]